MTDKPWTTTDVLYMYHSLRTANVAHFWSLRVGRNESNFHSSQESACSASILEAVIAKLRARGSESGILAWVESGVSLLATADMQPVKSISWPGL